MGEPLFLDSSVLIEYLRDRPGAAEFLESLPARRISAMTVIELFAGARNERERARLDDFFTAFEVDPVTFKTAREAGLMRQEHNTAVPDAVIAATAKLRGATLLTFNPRHFAKLVRVREPYSRRPSGG